MPVGISVSTCEGLKCLSPLLRGQFLLGHLGWCLRVWNVSPHYGCWAIWLGFEVSPPICRYWVAWLGFEMSRPICWCLVIWLGFEVSPPIRECWVIWLGFEVSYRSNMGLWCYRSGDSFMLTGFSTIMGVTGFELELLAWVLSLGSLCSLPSDLDQILP